MAITAAQVKQLRERTGAGMMDCKKALIEAGGDMDAAVDLMRKSGQATADKKAGRVAAEGVVVVQPGSDGRRVAMVEVNCETDFVARDKSFLAFAAAVAETIVERAPSDLDALSRASAAGGEGRTVNEWRQDLIARIGENIGVRRFELAVSESGQLASYVHNNKRIGVLVDIEGGDAALGRDVAMHIAASRPGYISGDQVPTEILAKEREIFTAQASQSGKPPHIVEKMVEGRLRKHLTEITLLAQPFVKDPDIDVATLLERSAAKVVRFSRFEVGEGIERKKGKFAEEVMAQVRAD
jgi:elongation factor Ts